MLHNPEHDHLASPGFYEAASATPETLLVVQSHAQLVVASSGLIVVCPGMVHEDQDESTLSVIYGERQSALSDRPQAALIRRAGQLDVRSWGRTRWCETSDASTEAPTLVLSCADELLGFDGEVRRFFSVPLLPREELIAALRSQLGLEATAANANAITDTRPTDSWTSTDHSNPFQGGLLS